MKTLSIDLETRSSVDIGKCGVYKYAESPDFDILLFGVSVDSGPITVYDLACGDVIPNDILAALSDERVTKWAYNASFERVCLSVWLRRNYPQYFSTYSIKGDPVQNYLDPASWKCTLVWAAYNGLPLGLEKVGAVLGFEEQKLKEGKELIRFFCTPSRTAGRAWNLPEHALDKWALFKKYNERDVQVEMQIQERLRHYPVPDAVWRSLFQVERRGHQFFSDILLQPIRHIGIVSFPRGFKTFFGFPVVLIAIIEFLTMTFVLVDCGAFQTILIPIVILLSIALPFIRLIDDHD